MNALNFPLQALQGAFDDIELTILFDYLELPRPAKLAGIGLEATRQAPLDQDAPDPVRLADSDDRWDYGQDQRLANAVTRLALNAIAGRLPQWGCVSAEGDVILGRKSQPRRPAKVDLLPTFLFEIDWADSGPGFSWPESDHATYLPGFHRYAVTMSNDSTDAHGSTGLAIGHFAAEVDVQAGARQVICDWWRDCKDGGDPAQAWEYLLSEGAIDAAAAYDWREEVVGIDADGGVVDEDEEEDE